MTIPALFLAAFPLWPLTGDPPQRLDLGVSDVQREALDAQHSQLFRPPGPPCPRDGAVLDTVQDHAELVHAPAQGWFDDGDALIDAIVLTVMRMQCRWDEGDRAGAWDDAAWLVEVHAAVRADDRVGGTVLARAKLALDSVLSLVGQTPLAHLPPRHRAALAGPVATDRERADALRRACLVDHEVNVWAMSPAWMWGGPQLRSALDWLSMPLFVQLLPRAYARGVSVCEHNHAVALGEDPPAVVFVGPMGAALGMDGWLEPGEANFNHHELDEDLARVDARWAAYLARKRGAPSR